jgi:hypothetical protein
MCLISRVLWQVARLTLSRPFATIGSRLRSSRSLLQRAARSARRCVLLGLAGELWMLLQLLADFSPLAGCRWPLLAALASR